MHPMAFYWSPNIGDFFFQGLTINGTGPFVMLCTVLVLLSVVYEAMKVHSAQVRARAARERLRASSCAPSETANLLAADRSGSADTSGGLDVSRCCSRRTLKALAEAAVFLVHNTLGYALMLSVMIFNGYVFLSVVLGMGLGYFLFGHISMRVNMENMQARTTKVICSPACAEDQPGSSTGRPSIADQPHQLECHNESGSSSGQPQVAGTVLQHKPELHSYPNYQSTSPSSHCTPQSSASSSPSRAEHNSRSHIVDSSRL